LSTFRFIIIRAQGSLSLLNNTEGFIDRVRYFGEKGGDNRIKSEGRKDDGKEKEEEKKDSKK
jgi:hypothetical protein